ncbi:hypothetical protein [Adhaeribacter soli]|uniref:PD(D/E)XK endonuclease domain-containing protein n=1 Tax=Adhaeribacter soli TaxID=2607655 RepID=A0A5N1IRN7_9BACT|nr:hypothetical protein [Adhaeribacter soli]KAA9332670.1 hypothetical protein F0P94_11725 [Adhaeribacter soli]
MADTNMASEFYVLSTLHRLGKNALLTLGNKKAVDILVEVEGRALTIDVKGIRDTTSFPIDNLDLELPNHFVVFVSFIGQIGNPLVLPEIHVVPTNELSILRPELNGNSLIYTSPGGLLRVQLGRLRSVGIFQNAWQLIN